MDLPIGTIILWDSGQIPAGWIICNGDNETIETRGRFIRGAGADAEIGSTGGTLIHTHTNSDTSTKASHNHGGSVSTSTGGAASVGVTSGSGSSSASTNHTHGVHVYVGDGGNHSHTVPTTDAASNLPKHIRRVFIMRVA